MIPAVLDHMTQLWGIDSAEPVKCDDTGWVGGPDVDCPNDAVWVARPGCGHTTVQCDEHKQRAGVYVWVCECGHQQADDMDWRRL